MISVYLVSRVVFLGGCVVTRMFPVSWKPSSGFLVGKIILSLFSFEVEVVIVVWVVVELVVVVVDVVVVMS